MAISRDVLYDPNPDGQGSGGSSSDGGTDTTDSAVVAQEQAPDDTQSDTSVA